MTRKEGRAFLSNKIWQEVNREMNKTDQMKGLPQPSLEKSSEGYDLISLPDPNSTHLIMKDLREIVFLEKAEESTRMRSCRLRLCLFFSGLLRV
ncbi:hypothetical protein [Mesotoga sp. Brook.08.YT.4.2.5.1]|uniref:hypothetical protein n=1 Tax=Mesotoga sp. Brook.08.YT.4.2.5.1 TaxID=1421001 RepID=UPI00215509ED|nr:hypothetical protein [Mesotoga sp. Brook.08.YT.4.2.5.1]